MRWVLKHLSICPLYNARLSFLLPNPPWSEHASFSHTARVPLKDYTPGTFLRYRYGSDKVGWSDERTMIVAPRPGQREDPPLR